MIFDYLFLPILFLIALITSYQDLKFGKIKNKWIILGLGYGLLIFFLFFIWGLVAQPITEFYYSSIKHLSSDSPLPVFTIQNFYLKTALINFLIAIIISFLMWHFSAWSAGDAKLFLVFALLLPLKYYYKTFLPFFPSFVLLVNIFIPIFIFLSIKALFFCWKLLIKEIKEKKVLKSIKELFKNNIVDISRLLILFLTMFLSAQLFQRMANFSFLNNTNKQLTALIIIYLISVPLTKTLKNKKIFFAFIIFSIFALTIGFVYYKEVFIEMFWRVLYMVMFFLVLIGLLRKVLNSYIEERGIKEIKIENLKPNSQISQEFLSNIKKELPEVYKSIQKERYFQPETLDLIKNFCINQKRTTISIYKSFPFAVWMFLGLILTIILKGSLFSLIL